MTTAPTTTPLVLRAAADDNGGKPLPLGLEGYPTEADGVQIHYRRMKIARAGAWTHRGTGEPVTIDHRRMDEWVANTQALAAAGVRPFLPGQHRAEFNAADNHGYVVSLSREGDDLYATVALYGEDARRIAAANGRSVYVVSNARDASGKVHEGESIAHVALVPNPALPDLGPTVNIAASAGGSAVEAPILEPATAQNRSPTMLKPETLQKLRTRFKLPDNAPEAEVAEKAAEVALTDPPKDQTAEVAKLSTDVAKLSKERDDAKAAEQKATLALSANAPRTPDAVTLAMYQDNISAKREAAIRSGALSEAEAKGFDAILADANGNPTPLALSASSGNRPLAFAVWDALGKLGTNGVRTGHALPRTGGDAALRLSGDPDADAEKVRADAKAEVKRWQDEQLRARGLQPIA